MSQSAAVSLCAIALFLVACSPESEIYEGAPSPVAGKPTPVSAERASLPEIFDCLRENKGTAIAAHRGGPYPGYPENAIETMQYNFDRGVRVFEIDIAESQDGVLFLMHDRSLTRTTTGEGFVAEWDWTDLQTLRLRDNNGEVTGFDIPSLSDALEWAVETGAIVELDKKPTTSFANIVSAVEAAGAEDNVIMISYNDDQAFEIARINPDLMMTASAFGGRDIRKLVDGGVNQDSLIAWTGTNEPDFAAWDRVLDEGVEAAFGTLGRPGERLDDTYLADGNGSEFQALVDAGLTLIATDAPLEVAEAINGDDIAAEVCGL
ncbi:MAG: glycerophosphodiester phosphodiesterase [Ponticaulis sp.]|nr:glycerophosphodiester phosphodiesterase [Ponticaulis sp.]